jgi:Domain of unknown function (DUF4287)/Domain of unknown function (DUF5655)
VTNLEHAVESQMRNIEQATGRSIAEWVAIVQTSGLERHGQILTWLKRDHGLSHGNANLVALRSRNGSTPDGDDLVDTMYSGTRSTLRPLHDRVIELATSLGADVELAPKKAYVSLRRSKQFGTVGPGPSGQLEIGLNLKGEAPGPRLQAAGGMCTHRVRLSSDQDLDAELVSWLRSAFDRA